MPKRILCILCMLSAFAALRADYVPRDYVWTSPSRNSSESMPCGGHDIGMNVWVERGDGEQRLSGDVLFYIAQSGWFDENNTLLKAGRWRLHFADSPFGGADFEQRLCLDEGCVYIRGGGTELRLWVDVEEPVVFVSIRSPRQGRATLSYESWRYRDRPVTKAECQQCSYKWVIPQDCKTYADSIRAEGDRLTFSHQNRRETVFDFTVDRERMGSVKSQLYNPIGSLLMRGEMVAPGFRYVGTTDGTYASTDYRSWNFRHDQLTESTIAIQLTAWLAPLTSHLSPLTSHQSKARSAAWWHAYWQRSWIQVDDDAPAECRTMVRNYELMRYMLGCNARGQWPTKFNGGLFTFDPVYVDSAATFTPDYRKWGGGTMTAQNQRLVYWPLLKSGDYDLLQPQLDFYLRCLPNAELRSQVYWHHGGACFTEQLENFGLPNPAEYGKKRPEGFDPGMERNAWLEYEWDTCLEFCMMALLARDYGGINIDRYLPLIRSCLTFFDEHYQYLADQRGAKRLDADGKLILYPGSGGETFKGAYNSVSTIAALHTVARAMGDTALLARLPDITLRDGMIAPALHYERVQNVETTQLYPVFPWRIYGLGRPGLDVAVKTYQQDTLALKFRSHIGWKQDNIWAACLGLTDEARRLCELKLADGPYRFPAFWGPGFDWSPDHNWGGSGMIGLQEMLLQETPDGQLLLFPAWPREWDVRFRLHATGGRVVEATMKNGVTHVEGLKFAK